MSLPAYPGVMMGSLVSTPAADGWNHEPGLRALRAVIGTAPDVAVYLSQVQVWPTSVLLEVNVHHRSAFSEDTVRALMHQDPDQGLVLEFTPGAHGGHDTLLAYEIRTLAHRQALRAVFYPPPALAGTPGVAVAARWSAVGLEPSVHHDLDATVRAAAADIIDPWSPTPTSRG